MRETIGMFCTSLLFCLALAGMLLIVIEQVETFNKVPRTYFIIWSVFILLTVGAFWGVSG